MQDGTAQYLQALDSALRGGKAKAAGEAFRELLGLAEDYPALGRELGTLLERLHEDFHVAAAIQFARWLARQPAEEVTAPALEQLQPRIERTEQWGKQLADLGVERRVRELRDSVRRRELDAAARALARLMQGASSHAERPRLARLAGAALGSLEHDRARVDKLVAGLERQGNKLGLDDEARQTLAQSLEKTRAELAMSDMGAAELQYNRIHTDLVVRLIRALPDSSTLREPDEEAQAKAQTAFQGLLAAYYFHEGPAGPREEMLPRFLDVARLLREFCPVDERATGPVQGVEGQAFLKLNPAARIAAVRALRAVGEKKRIADTVRFAVTHSSDQQALENLIVVMGGLSNPEFYPLLNKALEDRRFVNMRDTIVDALGRLGDPRSLERVRHQFERLASRKTLSSEQRREMASLLASLGRIARHPKTSDADRDALVRWTLEQLPEDRELGRIAMEHLLVYKPSSLAAETRRLAVKRILASLWSRDNRSKDQPGDDAPGSEHGFRAPLIKLLTRLGRDSLPLVLEAAEPRALQYSGAYWALADAFVEIDDPRALPLLKRMLKATLKLDETRIPPHLRETYYDAPSQQYKPLSRDKIAHALIYAIRKLGGDDALRELARLGREIRDGHYENPGPQTSNLLAEATIEARKLPDKPKPRPDTPDAPIDQDGEFALQPAADAGPRPRENDSAKTLARDIQGRGLIKPKPERRVSAIQEAAARGDYDLIPALAGQLASDDLVIRSACETALLELIDPRRRKELLTPALFSFLAGYKKADRARERAMNQLIDRLRPERDPIKSVILRFIETEDDEELKRKAANLFAVAEQRRQLLGERDEPAALPDTAPKEDPKADAPKAKPARKKTAMEAKREYFAARQAWIRGGKKGPEPKPPKE